MGFSDTLSQIYSSISSQSADLDEKISRLERAKGDIDNEQNTSLNEIRKILEPDLGEAWKGNRANTFDDARDEAHKTMKDIVNEDYDDYKQSIEFKITQLSMQRGMLDFAGGLANEASQLLDKGEEAFDELGSKLEDLKRRVF
ncbi:YwqH-like family protein [Metabacillus arenae]|uniref:DUF5082 family protein n=1 Tax=Metabacillus arenae TaxID=2771434 RepID=A0A926S034_9BACI|nr:DUF5082 family protein [Metabacillus arenae]MBD1379639.1 DUF5082 family protein [Metabacillus arenae]